MFVVSDSITQLSLLLNVMLILPQTVRRLITQFISTHVHVISHVIRHWLLSHDRCNESHSQSKGSFLEGNSADVTLQHYNVCLLGQTSLRVVIANGWCNLFFGSLHSFEFSINIPRTIVNHYTCLCSEVVKRRSYQYLKINTLNHLATDVRDEEKEWIESCVGGLKGSS